VADRLLKIYLQDHLAGATGGLELARRAASSNEGTPIGDFLEDLAAEIEEDRKALLEIMESLDVAPDKVKNAMGWGAEKLGRLKPNGQLTGYSPLSRVVELEGLTIGVRGKLSLFENLRATFGAEVAGRNIDGFITRFNGQLERLTEHRQEAARLAFEDEVTRVA
jgi:hypothetical protein